MSGSFGIDRIRWFLFKRSSLFSSSARFRAVIIKCVGYPRLIKCEVSIKALIRKSSFLVQMHLTRNIWENGIPLRICLGCSDEYSK